MTVSLCGLWKMVDLFFVCNLFGDSVSCRLLKQWLEALSVQKKCTSLEILDVKYNDFEIFSFEL